ncbi:hypothetical protein V499_03403 [Pseudogymnoascus sp. VKM F-103]|nr:hypothetical protein V499_03403 [Pseudogymnoascus sp. VKM F-103]
MVPGTIPYVRDLKFSKQLTPENGQSIAIAIYGGSIHLTALKSALFVFSSLAKVAPYGRWFRRMVPPHKWTIGITIICGELPKPLQVSWGKQGNRGGDDSKNM